MTPTSRIENLKGHLAAVERSLQAETDPARLAALEEDARRLRAVIYELEGRSLSGAGWQRP